MSKQTDFDKLDLLGVEVDALSTAEAIEYIIKRSAPGQPAAYVIKPYVEFLDRADRDLPLRDLLNNAELSLADGVALVWAAHYLYAGRRTAWRFWLTLFQIPLAPRRLNWPLPDRAAGINFTWQLLVATAGNQHRVFFIGDPLETTIEHTAKTLKTALPNLNIVGTHTGRDTTRPSGQASDQWLGALADAVSATSPDIILTGTGFPLQERINAYLAAHLEHGVFIGEGGTFDYEAFGGHRPKAPAAFQHLGLEWLWRLILEPSRLRRQLAIPRFIWRIWRNH